MTAEKATAQKRLGPYPNKAVAATIAAVALVLVVAAAATAAVPRAASVATIKPACSLLPLAVAERLLGTTAKEVPGGPMSCTVANKLNPSNSISIAINYPETKAAFAASHKGLVRIPGFGDNSGCTTVRAGYDQCEVFSGNEDILVSFDHRTRYTPGHNSLPLTIPLSAMATIYHAIVAHL